MSTSEEELNTRSTDAQLDAVRQELALLKQDLQLKETYLAKLRAEVAEREAHERDLQEQLRAIRTTLATSASWRYTAPLRTAMERLRRLRARNGA